MSQRFAFETPDPDAPGKIKTVLVDVPQEIAHDLQKREAFYAEHRALYPEPSKVMQEEGGSD